MTKAYVLLSGGVDSTTCLYLAAKEFPEVVGLSVDYGQRHRREIEYAKRSADAVGAGHEILDLSPVVPKTALTDPTAPVPEVGYDEIDGVSPVYVPFRNGLMLSAAASRIAGDLDAAAPCGGEEWGLYFGAHAEDAHQWAYPDCTPEFIGGMSNAIRVGTYGQLRLHAPLEWMGKADIIRLGERLGVDWRSTWSCYLGGEHHCGVCPTCRARRAGFAEAGVADPTIYSRTDA